VDPPTRGNMIRECQFVRLTEQYMVWYSSWIVWQIESRSGAATLVPMWTEQYHTAQTENALPQTTITRSNCKRFHMCHPGWGEQTRTWQIRNGNFPPGRIPANQRRLRRFLCRPSLKQTRRPSSPSGNPAALTLVVVNDQLFIVIGKANDCRTHVFYTISSSYSRCLSIPQICPPYHP
jgi:hypothetical protein